MSSKRGGQLTSYKMKWCPRCERNRREDKFYIVNAKRKNGTVKRLSGYCKDCTKAASIEWAKNNPEKARFFTERWKRENPEKYRESYLKSYQKRKKKP